MDALREVNLDPRAVADKLSAELSGGMRKRVGLARALVGRPGILLYDEPVTGLDPVNAASVARLIRDIQERRGPTSVMVTHDVKGALTLCDRIGLLHGGRLRFVGTPAEFRASADPLVRAFTDRAAAEHVSLKELEEQERVPA
jgi:phospholipid/cholesterol/gamma-HCH transport system ATP-binding protein